MGHNTDLYTLNTLHSQWQTAPPQTTITSSRSSSLVTLASESPTVSRLHCPPSHYPPQEGRPRRCSPSLCHPCAPAHDIVEARAAGRPLVWGCAALRCVA